MLDQHEEENVTCQLFRAVQLGPHLLGLPSFLQNLLTFILNLLPFLR